MSPKPYVLNSSIQINIVIKKFRIRNEAFHKIGELISHFSKHVANGEMKYYSAVRGLEEYILANISIFNGTYEDWKRRRKANQKAERTSKARQNRPKETQIKQYIMDAIDYYSKVREKYDKEQEVKEENRKKSLDETRKYMGH